MNKLYKSQSSQRSLIKVNKVFGKEVSLLMSEVSFIIFGFKFYLMEIAA